MSARTDLEAKVAKTIDGMDKDGEFVVVIHPINAMCIGLTKYDKVAGARLQLHEYIPEDRVYVINDKWPSENEAFAFTSYRKFEFSN